MGEIAAIISEFGFIKMKKKKHRTGGWNAAGEFATNLHILESTQDSIACDRRNIAFKCLKTRYANIFYGLRDIDYED